MQFRIGMALWGFDGWVGDFYPPGSSSEEFLELYVDRMHAVEGNTFFYAVPNEERVRAWSEVMPSDFRICPKLHREITHQGPLLPRKEKAATFIQRLKPFGTHLGPFHLQLPPSYGPDYATDLRRFLRAWPRSKGPIAVEVRHPGWFEPPHFERLGEMLERLGVAQVLLDSRPVHESSDDPQIHSDRQKPELPLFARRRTDFAVVRYIGHPDLERNDPYLDAWSEHVERWLDEGTRIYFFVHCPYEVHSPRIARRFQHLLEELDLAVPPLPWNELDGANRQERLF